jgi:hypothetical protein
MLTMFLISDVRDHLHQVQVITKEVLTRHLADLLIRVLRILRQVVILHIPHQVATQQAQDLPALHILYLQQIIQSWRR